MPANPRQIIVLSDTHLGPGAPLTTFREPELLARFIHRLAQEEATELVLAGDTFDLLQSPGYAGLDSALAPERVERILDNPDYTTLFEAMRQFTGKARHELTLLSGNHDPELMLPEVRELFEHKVGRSGSVRWADDEPLVPGDSERWPVWGRAHHAAGEQAWIVHGDRWDPFNAVDRARVGSGASVELPPGSRLVYEVLSGLKPGRSWIDTLKPEFPTVFLILLYLQPSLTWSYLQKNLGLEWRLLSAGVQDALGLGHLYASAAGGDRGEPVEDYNRLLGRALAEGLRGDGIQEIDKLEAWFRADVPPQEELVESGDRAEHGGVARALVRAILAALPRCSCFGELDQDDGLPGRARALMPPDCDLLVAGHTHGPRVSRDFESGLRYLNTGTWLPVFSLPQTDLPSWLDRLEQGLEWGAESPRSFARLYLGTQGIAANLMCCDESGSWRPLGGS